MAVDDIQFSCVIVHQLYDYIQLHLSSLSYTTEKFEGDII